MSSNLDFEIFTCSHCSQEFRASKTSFIDICKTPELKESILDWDFFVHKCPHCGGKQVLQYELSYLDEERGLSVIVLPFGDDNLTDKVNNVDENWKKFNKYNNCRIVGTSQELAEQIFINDAMLNDAIVALSKIFIAKVMSSKTGNLIYADDLYFTYFNGKPEYVVLLTLEGEETYICDFNRDLYNDLKREYGDLLSVEKGRYEHVSIDWVKSKVALNN